MDDAVEERVSKYIEQENKQRTVLIQNAAYFLLLTPNKYSHDTLKNSAIATTS